MSTPRVVVVEHDPDTREMFGEFLQLAGYNPILYHHMNLKPEDITALDTKVIVLDWSVRHEEEVRQFVEQVTNYSPTSTIPIIVCTAAPEFYMQQFESWLTGRNVAVLYKPFGIDDLIPVVARYVNRASPS